MSLRGTALSTFVFVACALAFEPTPAQADPIPTITITSATGFASWGQNNPPCPPGACASLSGPDGFTLDFSSYGPGYGIISPGGSFPTSWPLRETIGAPAFPGGTIAYNGTLYGVDYEHGTDVTGELSSSFDVPFGYATIQVPAVLVGSGIACTTVYGPPSGCFPPPTFPPDTLIANVDIDILGYMTVTFSPSSGPGVSNEAFTAVFTPVPEPSPVALVLIAIAVSAIWRLHERVRIS